MKTNTELKNTVTGFVLAVVLTLIPFLAVFYQMGSRTTLAALIAGTAIVQILVHLRFFLGIRFQKSGTDNLFPLLFACVLLFIMVGGTMWVMTNIGYRMGHQ
ncbi:MAG: cytochrome o ubiquinol oxidase subunit IV [Marinosulfonomonas sp.]